MFCGYRLGTWHVVLVCEAEAVYLCCCCCCCNCCYGVIVVVVVVVVVVAVFFCFLWVVGRLVTYFVLSGAYLQVGDT